MFRRTTLAFAAAAALTGASLAIHAQTPADAPKPMGTTTITADRDSARPADRNELTPAPADVASTQMSREQVKEELAEAERFGILEKGDVGASDDILANREAYNEHIEALSLMEGGTQPSTAPEHPAVPSNPAPDSMGNEQMPSHPALQERN